VGRLSVLRRGRLPAPFHFTGSFLRMRCLGRADKVREIALALLAIRRESYQPPRIWTRISMLDWLLQKRQTPRAIDRFWRQVLVSAVNEDLEPHGAVHGFRCSGWDSCARPIPTRWESPRFPLRQLYAAGAWQRLPNVRLHVRAPVERIDGSGFTVGGERRAAAHYIARCLRADGTVGLAAPARWNTRPSPACTLWFDREVRRCACRHLLGRTMQWMSQPVGTRSLLATGGQRLARADQHSTQRDRGYRHERPAPVLSARAGGQPGEAHVVKEQRATFSRRAGNRIAFGPR